MEWLKKKKDEAKQAAAKLQNKRPAFKGEGNVLGGGDGTSAGDASANARSGAGSALKLPSFGKSAPPALTPEQQRQRREQQQKALEQRGNAWEKRVDKARKARLQREEENAARLGAEPPLPLPPPPPPSSSSSAMAPPPVVLTNEEVKAREVRDAHAQMGFNPYAATFSSSSEASAAMHSIGGGAAASAPAAASAHSGAPSAAAFLAPGETAPPVAGPSVDAGDGGGGAVFVLLRQEPARAMAAAETLIKLLGNVVRNPQDDKFRKVRLSNAAIQAKLAAVNGALDMLREAGFSDALVDGEPLLVLAEMDPARVQAAADRAEVALSQLRHDSESA